MYNITDKSSAIKAIQRFLQLEENGNYDIKTTNKVKEVQSTNGINATGIVDYETFKEIIQHYNERVSSSKISQFLNAFPYNIGNTGNDVATINIMLSEAIKKYSLFIKSPKGNYYSEYTENAVQEMKKILRLDTNPGVDKKFVYLLSKSIGI